MTDEPLVSVVIPAFNAASTVRETVASAQAGTYQRFEIIVIDDGSTDSTAAIVQELCRKDERLKLHRQPNGGLASALNTGFALASGDYIARLDADDLWHPAKLERQVELARREPDLAFVYCWVRYIDEQGRVVLDGPQQRFPRSALCRGLYESLVGGGSSALMRRDAVLEAGGVEKSFPGWEDLVLQLKISAHHPIAAVPEYLVGYRLGAGSMSANPSGMLAGWSPIPGWAASAFPQIPPRVRRWAHARRCAHFAETFAWRGRPTDCAKLLLAAAARDPAWTGRFLAFRAARHLKKRRSGAARAAPPGPPFLSCDPTESVRPDPYEAELEGTRLRRLEERRLREIEALDARGAT